MKRGCTMWIQIDENWINLDKVLYINFRQLPNGVHRARIHSATGVVHETIDSRLIEKLRQHVQQNKF
jgi:hypothetical protein